MTPHSEKNGDEILLKKLKEILLKEERERVDTIQEQLDLLKTTFPKQYEGLINKLIEEKIKSSQDDIVNAIFPSVGKMIKKYINLQIETLKDSVDDKFKKAFTIKDLFRNVKSSLFGVKLSDEMLTSLVDFQIEEVYLIQKDSGLLIGSASRETTLDQDVIAGMLTAIKAFVEDAFKREKEDLESIQYGTYKIILQNFHSYYIAMAISGILSSTQKDQLGNRLLNFADTYLKRVGSQPNQTEIEEISEHLKEEFLS